MGRWEALIYVVRQRAGSLEHVNKVKPKCLESGPVGKVKGKTMSPEKKTSRENGEERVNQLKSDR